MSGTNTLMKLATLALLALATTLAMAAPSPTKRIVYRGGIAEFRIPANWKEDYDPKGGASFYEDKPDSGMLMVNVLGFDSDKPAKQMAEEAFKSGDLSRSKQGFPVRHREAVEQLNGHRYRFTRWEVAVPVPPNSLRLVIFSYGTPVERQEQPAVVADIAMLEKSLRSAVFSQVPGVAGDYEHAP